jgi:hypothetical protein
MTKPSALRPAVWRALFLVTCFGMLVSLAVAQTPAVGPPSNGKEGGVNPQAASLQEFQTRLDQYFELRNSLSKKLQPLSPTPNAAELERRQEALAAAIRRARTQAKRGDLIPPAVAQLIATIVRDDFQRRNPTAKMGVFEEVAARKGASLINKSYPADQALPTVPPLLLMNLPKLPDNLQYRFVGRDIVILDGDLQVVVDYIPTLLPAR